MMNLHSCVDGLGVCGKGKNNPNVREENILFLLIFLVQFLFYFFTRYLTSTFRFY